MLDITGIALVVVVAYAVLGYIKPGVALVTVPFVAFALGYAALILDPTHTDPHAGGHGLPHSMGWGEQ